jgi:hypothetical protein
MVSISIVTYNNDKVIKKCLQNIFQNINNTDFELIIVDNNSSDSTVSIIEKDFKNVRLIKNNRNIGFGAAHNIAIKLGRGKYHLVLNPDIIFTENAVEKLLNFMEKNPDVGLVSPKILFPNGSIQYLCRRLPSLFDFIIIRFMPKFIRKFFQARIDYYEMRQTGYNKIMDVLFLAGAFMLIRSSVLDKIGGFDENFFMYFEDIDLCRRIKKISRTVFYPHTSVIHLWEGGTRKNIQLLLTSIKSAIYYFNKWGWKLF